MLLGCCGIGRFEFPERIKNDLRNDQTSVVLIVCGNYIPGGMMRAGRAQALFVSLYVFLPELSLLNVCEAQLPVLFRIVDAGICLGAGIEYAGMEYARIECARKEYA